MSAEDPQSPEPGVGKLVREEGAESFGAMVQRAIDKGVPVETMERLLAMYEKIKAAQAKAAFDRALAAFQAECPTIQKTKKVMNKDGRSVRYQYAPLEVIIQQVKTLLQKHGFSYTVDADVQPGLVRATCTATHALGHSKPSSFSVPIDKDAYMNPAQQCASALTFAKRYAFCDAFGIMTGDEDDDSQASHPTSTAAQAPTAAKPAPAKPAVKATPKTRAWFLDKLRESFDEPTLLSYAVARGYLEGEGLESWALDKVLLKRTEIAKLQADILEFVKSGKTKAKPKANGKTLPTSPQGQLATLCTAAGFSFDEFSDWAVATGNLEPDKFTTFEDFPEDRAEFFVRSFKSILKALQAARGQNEPPTP
jgi:ERF superfamily